MKQSPRQLMLRTMAAMAFIFMLTITVSAQLPAKAKPFPAGQWTFKAYTDQTGAYYSTNSICIKPDGKWYATNNPSGSGSWYMKGTKLYLHGNYSNSLSGYPVNDSFDLTISADKKIMTGFLQEWNDGNNYNGYYRVEWTIVSTTLCNEASK